MSLFFGIDIPRSPPSDLTIIEVAGDTVVLRWEQSSSDVVESFIINCTSSTNTISIELDIENDRIQQSGSTSGSANMESGSTTAVSGSTTAVSGSTTAVSGSGSTTAVSGSTIAVSGSGDLDSSGMQTNQNTFIFSLTDLPATTYSCSVTARNVFGAGPASEAITITTGTYSRTPVLTLYNRTLDHDQQVQ